MHGSDDTRTRQRPPASASSSTVALLMTLLMVLCAQICCEKSKGRLSRGSIRRAASAVARYSPARLGRAEAAIASLRALRKASEECLGEFRASVHWTRSQSEYSALTRSAHERRLGECEGSARSLCVIDV